MPQKEAHIKDSATKRSPEINSSASFIAPFLFILKFMYPLVVVIQTFATFPLFMKSAFTALFMHQTYQWLKMHIISLFTRLSVPAASHQKTLHLSSVWDKSKVRTTITRLTGKTTTVTLRVQYVPLGWGSGLLTVLCATLSFDAWCLRSSSQSASPKKKSGVHTRWQIHSSEDNVLLWGATCHSLPRVGHTFLSLPWWISFPRPHVDLSGLKGRLWVSSSQHHKVPFVPSTMRSIHTWPHEDTLCQRMAQPWGRTAAGLSWTNRDQWEKS